jgi:hypothetical protein
MSCIPRIEILGFRDVEWAAAVVRYVAERTPSVEEFHRLADLLGQVAAVWAGEDGDNTVFVPALASISFPELVTATAVAMHIAELAPPGDEDDEFVYLTRLLREYTELANLYYELDEDQRRIFLSRGKQPRGMA